MKTLQIGRLLLNIDRIEGISKNEGLCYLYLGGRKMLISEAHYDQVKKVMK